MVVMMVIFFVVLLLCVVVLVDWIGEVFVIEFLVVVLVLFCIVFISLCIVSGEFVGGWVELWDVMFCYLGVE